MKIPTRPSLVALLAAAGVALVGCPEKPPQPRTARPTAPPLAAAPAVPAPVALRGRLDFLVDHVGSALVNVAELTVPATPRNS